MAVHLETRLDYIDFVERQYFGALQEGDYQKVLSHFHPDAILIAYLGEAAPRTMKQAPKPGEFSLDEFMLAATYFELRYTDFMHVVDPTAQRVASHFHLHMSSYQTGPMQQTPVRNMRNCSFFEFERGLLKRIVAFFSPVGEQPAGPA